MSQDDWTESTSLAYLWDQYRYRHELCWNAIYKITAAVIGLGALPYIKDEVMKNLGHWVLVPPIVATALAAMGIFVVNNELRLFARTKLAHYRREVHLLGTLFESSGPLHEEITPENARKTLFDWYAHMIVIALFVLSFVNVIFVCASWIPRLEEIKKSPAQSSSSVQ